MNTKKDGWPLLRAEGSMQCKRKRIGATTLCFVNYVSVPHFNQSPRARSEEKKCNIRFTRRSFCRRTRLQHHTTYLCSFQFLSSTSCRRFSASGTWELLLLALSRTA